MAEETKTSGETPHNSYEHPQHVFIQEYIDEEYDPELETYRFFVITYSGDYYRLCFTPHDIKRFNLFMSKEQADQKYFKHIINK